MCIADMIQWQKIPGHGKTTSCLSTNWRRGARAAKIKRKDRLSIAGKLKDCNT